MPSRMPFPDPTIAVVVIAGAIAIVLPLCMKKETIPQNDQSSNHESDDPFADNYNPHGQYNAPKSIVIKTKFVKVSSGTEELDFDWIVPATGD